MPRRPLLLVVGSSGFLGQRVVEAGLEVARVLGASRSGTAGAAIDITDAAAVDTAIGGMRPTAIINVAAANPGADPARLVPVNRDGAAHVARAATSIGARLVHVSTDVVHDGTAGPYIDDAPPSPVNAYGRSKAAGEDAVLAEAPTAAIIRTSLIFDPDRVDRPTEEMAARLAAGEQVTLWGDVLRHPTPARALAEALVRLAVAEPGVFGHLNLAGGAAYSRANLARRLLAHHGCPDVGATTIAEAPPEVPRDLRLVLTRSQGLGLAIPDLETTLA